MAVLEVARMRCLPGQGDELAAGLAAGASVIAGHPGCLEVQVHRGVEHPDEFILLATWESVPAHQDYLRSARSPEFRSHIEGSRDPQSVEASHYAAVAGPADASAAT